MPSEPPKSILIVGSGVFGLSTALALTQRPSFTSSKITLLDRSPFPSPDGSSIDSSRIIRADYSSPAYAHLASAAQSQWRLTSPSSLGGSGRYNETGLVLVSNTGAQGEHYVQASIENVKCLAREAGDAEAVLELPDRSAIEAAVKTGGGSGDWGYVNRRSGWADAEASMLFLRSQVEATGRVEFLTGEAMRLVTSSSSPKSITGIELKTGETLHADLTILATGAWTPSLLDLRGRATATGQILAYVSLSAAEQEQLGKMPVLLNMSTGLFIIPPRNQVLKIARHAYGYTNPVSIPNPDPGEEQGEEIIVSLPRTSWEDPGQCIPAEGVEACRKALAEMIPSLASRPFTKTRICWYTDTPNGDFLISYHPEYKGLFLATGGSGHGFKFLPVIGEKIVDCVEGKCPEEFREKWAWPKEKMDVVTTEDGSRGGVPGLVLMNELAQS